MPPTISSSYEGASGGQLTDCGHQMTFLFIGHTFWVDAFKHSYGSCTSSSACNSDGSIMWLDGTQVNHNSSHLLLSWNQNIGKCAFLTPTYYPRNESTLSGSQCSEAIEFMCSAPCDDQSKNITSSYLLKRY